VMRAHVGGGLVVLFLFCVVTTLYPMGESRDGSRQDADWVQRRFELASDLVIQILQRSSDPSWPEGPNVTDPKQISLCLSALWSAEHEATIRAVRFHGLGSPEHVHAAAAWWRATCERSYVAIELLAQQELASALATQAREEYGWVSSEHKDAFEVWQHARYLLYEELWGDFG